MEETVNEMSETLSEKSRTAPTKWATNGYHNNISNSKHNNHHSADSQTKSTSLVLSDKLVFNAHSSHLINSSPEIEQLLEEYMRVINNKETTIHEYIKNEEMLRAASKYTEDTLKRKLAKMHRELHRKNEEVLQCKQEWTKLEREVASLTEASQFAANAAQLAERKAETQQKELEHKLQEVTEKWTSVLETNEILQRRLDTLSSEKSQVSSALEMCNSKCTKIEEQYQEKCCRVEALLKEVESQRCELVKMQEALNNSIPRATAEQQVKELQVALNLNHESKIALTAQLDNARQLLHDTQIKCDESVQRGNNQEIKLNEYKQQIAIVEMKVNNSAQQSQELLTQAQDKYKSLYQEHQGTLNKLLESEDQLRMKTNAWHEVTLSLTKHQAEARERAETMANDNKHIKEACTKAELLAQQLSSQNKTLEEQHAQLTKQMHSLTEEHVKCMASLNEKLLLATEQEKHTSEELRRVNGVNTQLEQRLHGMEHAHENSHREFAARKEELFQQLQQSKSQQGQLENEMKRMKINYEQEVQQLQHIHKEENEQRNKLHENALMELNAQIDRMKRETLEQHGDTRNVFREREHYAEVQHELHNELMKLRREITAKESEMKALHAKLERAQAQATRCTAENESLEHKYTEMHQKWMNAERTANEAKENECQVGRRLERALRELQVAEDNYNKLEVTLQQREGALAKCKEENSLHVAALHVEQGKIQELLQQRTLLQGQLDEAASRYQTLQHVTLKQKEREVSDLQEEIRHLQSCLREQEEAKRKSDQEMEQVVEHAARVERLAEETAQSLRQARADHNAELAEMRRAQKEAIVLLPEANAKNKLLEERLTSVSELYETKINYVNEQVMALERTLTERDKSMEALKEELERREREWHKTQGENKAMSEAISVNEKTYKEKRAELQSMREELSHLRDERDAAKELYAKECEAMEELQSRYKRERVKMMSLMEEKEQVVKRAIEAEQAGRAREQTLLTEVDKHEKRIAEIQNEMERVSVEWSNKLKAAHTERLVQVEAVRRTLQTTEHDKIFLQGEVEQLQDRINKLESNLQKGTEVCETWRRQCFDLLEMAAETSKTYMAEVYMMQHAQHYELYTCTLKKLMYDVMRAYNKLSLLNKEWNDKWKVHCSNIDMRHQAEIDLMRSETTSQLSHAKEEHERRITEWTDKYKMLQEQQTQLTAQHAIEIQKCEEAKTEWTIRLGTLEAELQQTKREWELLQIKYVSSEERLTLANATIASSHAQHLQDVQALERNINELTSELHNNERELNELRKNYTLVQRQHQDALNEVDKLKRQVIQHDDRNSRWHVNYDERRIEVNRLQQQVIQLQKHAAAQMEKYNNTITEHAAELEHLQQQAAQSQTTIHALQHERRRLEHQLEDLHLAMENCTREVSLLHRSESDLNAALQAARADASTAREKCANTESLRVIAENTLAETQLREKELIIKVDDLRSSLQVLQICFDTQKAQIQEQM